MAGDFSSASARGGHIQSLSELTDFVVEDVPVAAKADGAIVHVHQSGRFVLADFIDGDVVLLQPCLNCRTAFHAVAAAR